jgi:hypothetical protein
MKYSINSLCLLFISLTSALAAPQVVIEIPNTPPLTNNATISFAPTTLGNCSQPVYFIIRNIGQAPLENISITLGSGNVTSFQISVQPPISSLLPSGSLTFTASFQPSAAGISNSSLRITTNDPNRSVIDLSLTGTGQALPNSVFHGVRLNRMMSTGDSAPDYALGGTFTSFIDYPVIGEQKTLFRGTISTSAGNRNGVWIKNHQTGEIRAGIIGGGVPTHAPAGSQINNASLVTMTYGPDANVAAAAFLTSAPGVTVANDRIVVSPNFPQSGSFIQTREGESTGIPGWTLSDYTQALMVNAVNSVAFIGTFNGSGVNISNENHVWTNYSTSRFIARQGFGFDTVPSAPGDYFITFRSCAYNNAGITTFIGDTYNRTSLVNSSYLIARGQGINAQIANPTAPPPGLASNFRFQFLPNNITGLLTMRMTGGLDPWIVFCDTARTSSGSTREGIWAWKAGVLSKVVIQGDTTVSPLGLTVTPNTLALAVNSVGQVAFPGTLAGPGVNSTNDGALLVKDPGGELVVLYRKGITLPGMPTNAVVSSFSAPTLAESGRLAFVASYLVNGVSRSGLWARTASGLRLICETQVPIPGYESENDPLTSLVFRQGGDAGKSDVINSSSEASSPSGWLASRDTLVFYGVHVSRKQSVWSASGNAVLNAPSLVINSATGSAFNRLNAAHDFGIVQPAAFVPPSSVTLRNSGEAPLSNLSLAIEGPQAADFSIDSISLLPMTAGEQRILKVRFTPGASGKSHAFLRIATNDPKGDFILQLVGATIDPAEIFTNWAATVGLSGPNTAPTATPFNDGVENLLKYAFNMNPVGPDVSVLAIGGSSGLPQISVDSSGAEQVLKVAFLRRKGSGLIYTPQRSDTLGNFQTMTGTQTVISIDAQWERITVQEPAPPATAPSAFARVQVTLP